jgi:hypothetical protein
MLDEVMRREVENLAMFAEQALSEQDHLAGSDEEVTPSQLERQEEQQRRTGGAAAPPPCDAAAAVRRAPQHLETSRGAAPPALLEEKGEQQRRKEKQQRARSSNLCDDALSWSFLPCVPFLKHVFSY